MKSKFLAYFRAKNSFAKTSAKLIFMALFLFSSNFAFAAPNTDSMLGYWKFDGNSNDSSEHTTPSNLLPGGAPSFPIPMAPDDVFLNSFSFPNSNFASFGGTADYFHIDGSSPNLKPVNAMTFSMWIKPDFIPLNQTIGGNFDAGGNGFGFSVVGTNPTFFLSETGIKKEVPSSILIDASQWHHLVGTLSGGVVRIYVDGIFSGSASFSGEIYYGSVPTFSLGRFSGKVDDVRLYNRALTSTEISVLASRNHTSINWDGDMDSNFENAGNWDLGIVPDPYTTVNIRTSVSPVTVAYPILTSPVAMAGLNIMDASSSFDLQGNNLTINDSISPGKFSNNGTLKLTSASSQFIEGFHNDIDSGTVLIYGSGVSNLKTGSQYYNLTMNGTGTITHSAALDINKDLTCNSGSLSLSQAMTVDGTVSIGSGNLSVSGITTVLGNILVGGGNFNAGDNTTVDGNVSISSGNFTLSNSASLDLTDLSLTGGTLSAAGTNNVINLYGNWSKTSGTFIPGTSTLNLVGTNQSIYGNNDFYNLTKISPSGGTLSFLNSSMQSIAGTLRLEGGAMNLLNLRSLVLGTPWTMSLSSTPIVQNLDVKDSAITGLAINATTGNITDSGNNTGWIFDDISPEILISSPDPSFTKTSSKSISGTASDNKNVAEVKYSLDQIEWLVCSAGDGNFGGVSESFTCAVSGLLVGTNTVYFKAIDQYLNESIIASINIVVDTTPPAITLDTIATPIQILDTVSGTATDASGISGVEININLNGGGWVSGGSCVLSADTYTCTIDPVLSDGTYSIKTGATDQAGNSSASNLRSVVIDSGAPSITSVNKTVGSGSAVISWNTNESSTSTVQHGPTLSYGFNGTGSVGLSHSVTIDISGTAACTTHYFLVESTDGAGNTATSAGSFTTLGCPDSTPPVLSSIAVSAGTTSATITWTTDESATTVIDYGTTSSYGTTSTDSNKVINHSATITGLNSCTTYHYKLISEDAASNIGNSSDRTFTTGGCATDTTVCEEPGDPEITSAEADGTDSIILKINDGDGEEDSYKIKYGTSSGSYQWEVDNIDENDIDPFTIGELSAGTTYYFKVRSENDCGDSGWSDEESAKTDEASYVEPTTTTPAPVETIQPTTQPVQTQTSEPETPVTTTRVDYNGDTSLGWQMTNFGSEYCYEENKCGASADPDGDGMINSDEFRFGTDPNKADSDGDGTEDGTEIEQHKDPTKSSSEQGGDSMVFENAKEAGTIEKDKYEVEEVEMVDVDGKKKLKLSGKGLPNSYVTIFIYSDPIVVTVKTDENGNWTYVLDGELADGNHEAYVGVTDSTGKIKAKSEPLAFVKTAEAATKISISEAQAASPVEKTKNNFLIFFIIISSVAVVLSLLIIGWRHRLHKQEENSF